VAYAYLNDLGNYDASGNALGTAGNGPWEYF